MRATSLPSRRRSEARMVVVAAASSCVEDELGGRVIAPNTNLTLSGGAGASAAAVRELARRWDQGSALDQR